MEPGRIGALISPRPLDAFLADVCSLSPVAFLEALERVRTRLRNPPVSRRHHLDVLRRMPVLSHPARISSSASVSSRSAVILDADGGSFFDAD